MITFGKILEGIIAFFQAIPLLAKYFPPKSTEQKVEDGEAKIDDKIKKEEETGRPTS